MSLFRLMKKKVDTLSEDFFFGVSIDVFSPRTPVEDFIVEIPYDDCVGIIIHDASEKFETFLGFLVEARVFDGDGGLVGEGLDERDMASQFYLGICALELNKLQVAEDAFSIV